MTETRDANRPLTTLLVSAGRVASLVEKFNYDSNIPGSFKQPPMKLSSSEYWEKNNLLVDL